MSFMEMSGNYFEILYGEGHQSELQVMSRKPLFKITLFLLLLLMTGDIYAEITAKTLAVIVNKSDPLSIKIAKYYEKVRGIPERNMIEIELDKNKTVISPDIFKKIKMLVDASTPDTVQGFVLTWAKPYRVGCMSITSAFAFGFDKAYCSKGCGETKTSVYYNSETRSPYTDYKMRPTVSLAALTFKQAKKLIDRGKLSDSTFPPGTGYLVSTSDKARNVRSAGYQHIIKTFPLLPHLEIVHANYIKNRRDVLFYFTGLKNVPEIRTNHFLPGAIADHLTSTGGMLTDSRQMSILKWLQLGATGSYGTVKEACNFRQKFPDPAIVIKRYTSGETLMEAYWKSVAWPGEGIFIGDPLASPFKSLNTEHSKK